MDRGRSHSHQVSNQDDLRGRDSNRRLSTQQNIVSSCDSASSGAGRLNGRTSFTRSRSPAVTRLSKPIPRSQRTLSPSGTSRHRPTSVFRNILPTNIQIHTHVTVPLTLFIDTRLAGECLLLLSSLLFVISKLSGSYPIPLGPPSLPPIQPSILELSFLVVASLIYIIWAHTSSSPPHLVSPLPPDTPTHPTRSLEGRESRRHSTPPTTTSKNHFGFIWMSVPKNYRYAYHTPFAVLFNFSY